MNKSGAIFKLRGQPLEPTYRHEFKYLCTAAQLAQIENRIRNMLPLDKHAREQGFYIIRSLYFDDIYDTYFNENLNGTDSREKFRIRIYNSDSSVIRLELKRKERGKTQKLSCAITEEQCRILMKGQLLPADASYPFLLQKLSLLMRTRLMKPKVIVEYTRVPYVYDTGTVRITFDKEIASSSDCAQFLEKDIFKRPVMPAGRHILEVKYNEFLPDFIYQQVHINHLLYTAFSKYFLCRKYNTKGEIFNEF